MRPPARPTALRGRVFRSRDAHLLTRNQLESQAWRRIFRGVYADARAESPPESVVRVLLRSAGLTPVPQYVVRDAEGRFVARVDLAFPEQRVAVEYDGAWHGRPGELGRDRRRHNALAAAGWTVLHITAADMYEPDAVVASVARLLSERGVVRLSTTQEGRVSPRSTYS